MEVAEKQGTVDITIFVTCYNEQDLIISALETIRTTMALFSYTYEVLIYDDASKDNSVQVIQDYVGKNGLQGQFELVVNPVNQGIGINYFRAAERGRGEYFMIVHGDNAVKPVEIGKMINLLGRADIIVPYYGTRLFSLKYNYDHRNFMRRLLSLTFAMIVRILSGHELRYFNGLVIHRRETLLKHRINAYGLGFQAELLCRILNDPNVSYLEVKLHNDDRTSGPTSAFKWRNIISVCGSLWRIFLFNPNFIIQAVRRLTRAEGKEPAA
ncbi:MAG: glycosyltransferase family 2 protein [Verrucomicrobia bacterium]|nr:glycosyltransferase family 2 protein [Verrucomicrobiota bacterium]